SYLFAFDQPTRQLTIAVNVKTGMKAALAITSLMFSCLKYLKFFVCIYGKRSSIIFNSEISESIVLLSI
ncbi:MAG TPA: hypothetical protein VF220_09735, partial [Nitrososphaeraceae archaeon]